MESDVLKGYSTQKKVCECVIVNLYKVEENYTKEKLERKLRLIILKISNQEIKSQFILFSLATARKA